MKKILVLLTVLLSCALLWGAAPAKEKAAEPQGVKYVYIDQTTPAELVTAIRDKGLKLAFLFDPAQAAWLKTVLPTLKGSIPLVFVRGNLTPAETAELKKTLDLFAYEVTLFHVKLTAGDAIGVVPVTSLLTIERIEDYDNKWVDFELYRGADKPERAVLQDKRQDPQNFGTPFTVAGGILFKRSGVCLLNLDRAGASLPKGMPLMVLFSTDAEKLKKFLAK
jgi:hypothetical protein